MSCPRHSVSSPDIAYTTAVPKLWDDTIEAHRRSVQDAILDTTAALVAARGLRAVTMSQIAEETGIGRATLYKYFPDVEAILLAWHERQVTAHLAQLEELPGGIGEAGQRLEAVLEAYALMHHEYAGHHRHGGQQNHTTDVAALLHRGDHVARAEQRLSAFMRDLLAECAGAGLVRDDVAPGELAGYCMHTLTAASNLPSKAAARRLVTVTLAGLRPPR